MSERVRLDRAASGAYNSCKIIPFDAMMGKKSVCNLLASRGGWKPGRGSGKGDPEHEVMKVDPLMD